MKKQNLFKTQKGITLVALVVTIVVLLILAGISINLVLGQNGIVAKSKEAKDKTANASDLEKINLAVGEATLDGLGELSKDKLESALGKQFGEEKATVEETDGEYIITVGDEQYVISKDGEVSEYKKDETPGTPDEIAADTFQINSIEDLIAVSYSVNKGEDTYQGKTIELGRSLNFESNLSYANPEAKYTLETDSTDATIEIGYKPDEKGTSIKELLLGDTGYIPIGTRESGGFYGTIEGNNYKIKNMKMTPITTIGGLVGLVPENTTLSVSNVKIENANINVSSAAGGIVGDNRGEIIIDNCSNVGGTVYSSPMCGGIAGYSFKSTVTNSYNKSTLGVANSTTGGMIGICVEEATITNCYNEGQLTGVFVGGIAGSTAKTMNITDCYNEGKITATNEAGGITGMGTSTEITIDNCYNKGTVTSSSSNSGGIAGASSTSMTINNCYNEGKVTAPGNSGGIIGFCPSKEITITNCYNAGTIIEENMEDSSFGLKGNSGGIIGLIGYTTNSGTIENSYNKGTTSGEVNSGEIIGLVQETTTSMAINNSYYLQKTTEVGIGENLGTVTGEPIPKKENEMNVDTFLEDLKGSETNTAWTRVNGINDGMPILSWQVKKK